MKYMLMAIGIALWCAGIILGYEACWAATLPAGAWFGAVFMLLLGAVGAGSVREDGSLKGFGFGAVLFAIILIVITAVFDPGYLALNGALAISYLGGPIAMIGYRKS
jgi:hypothetical protein